MTPSNSPREPFTNTVSDSPHGLSPGGCSNSGLEEEKPSISTGIPWDGQRSCQQPDRYTAKHSIGDAYQMASNLIPSLLILVGLLLVVVMAPKLDTLPWPWGRCITVCYSVPLLFTNGVTAYFSLFKASVL